MYTYSVGNLYYRPNRTNWPGAIQYNFRGGEHEFILFLNKPTGKEVHAIRRGDAEFALYVERRLIIFLYRFSGAFSWSDAPYTIHLVPPEERVLPPLTTLSEQALLHIVLVSADDGIIRAMRALSMPAQFTQDLHRAIREQAGMPFTRSAYNQELDALFTNYSSEELASMAGSRFFVAGR